MELLIYTPLSPPLKVESHSYSRRLPALGWIPSLWHSEHWAEITLRQHHLWPSQCFVLIKPVVVKMNESCMWEKLLLILIYLMIDDISSLSLLTVGFPLSAPVLSWLFIALRKAYASPGRPKSYQDSPQREPQSVPAATSFFQGLLGPTLRANPFSEGTDLFCRLPCRYQE